MQRADLVHLYPYIFHMAAAGSWPSIRRHGLLSSSALVSRWGADPRRVEVLRRESIVLDHPDFGRAIVRDQKPLHRESLEKALHGDLSVEEWLAELNGRVFFFVQRESLHGLMNSPAYRRDQHDVLTIDTASLVAKHGDEIELTGMNTGFARPHVHKPRGLGTFQRIEEYNHPKRDVARIGSSRPELVELCIRGAVHDIVEHVIRVERMSGGEVLEVINT